MPRTHERSFRIRHYECDAYENVYYTNYLRYMQETAMDASAAAGFDANWYNSRGYIWLVRESRIEFRNQLRYGDSVRVRTWVKNIRQSLSKRAYEFYRERDGELVARADTNWAFIDTTSGKPARISPEFMEAFRPDDTPVESFRIGIPNPSPGPDAQTHRRRVEWSDIDPAQHVNNSVYLAYSEDCAVEAVTACGWPPARMREHGFSMRMFECRIEYRVPTVLGDELTVTTWLSSLSERLAVRCFVLKRGDITVARAYAGYGGVDPSTLEGVDFPPEFIKALAPQADRE